MIPKTLWLFSPLTDDLKWIDYMCIKSDIVLNPDYEIVFLTDGDWDKGSPAFNKILDLQDQYSNFIVSPINIYEREYLELYEKIRHRDSNYPLVICSDILRFYYLWKHGGCYLDWDVFSIKSIPDISPYKFFIANDGGGETNAFMGAERGNKILKEILDTFENTEREYGRNTGVYLIRIWYRYRLGNQLDEKIFNLKYRDKYSAYQSDKIDCRFPQNTYFFCYWDHMDEVFQRDCTNGGYGFENLNNVHGFHLWHTKQWRGEEITEDWIKKHPNCTFSKYVKELGL